MLVTAGYFNYTANIENNSVETYAEETQNTLNVVNDIEKEVNAEKEDNTNSIEAGNNVAKKDSVNRIEEENNVAKDDNNTLPNENNTAQKNTVG